MRKKYRATLFIAAAVIAAMMLFPPFVAHGPDGRKFNFGYAFVLAYPDGDARVPVVNTAQLIAQIVGVCSIAALVAGALKD